MSPAPRRRVIFWLVFGTGLGTCLVSTILLTTIQRLTLRESPFKLVAVEVNEPANAVREPTTEQLIGHGRSIVGSGGAGDGYENMEETFKGRRTRVLGHCDDIKNVSSPRKRVELILPKLSLWYCAIPKCASTALKHFLENVSNLSCGRGLGDIHRCAFKLLMAPTIREASVSLIVVRNPWRRLVSGYVDKVVHQRSYVARRCYEYNSVNLLAKNPITFAQFCRCLVSQMDTPELTDPHFGRQFLQCPFCEKTVQEQLYIVKLENLESEFLYVIRAAGAKGEDLRFFKNVLDSSPRRKNEIQGTTEARYSSFYKSLDTVTVAALMEYFKHDCTMFGYPLSPLE